MKSILRHQFGVILALAVMSYPVLAEEVRVEVNQTPVSFPGQSAVLESGRVLIPLRGVLEHLGAEVSWDPTKQKVTARRGEDTVVLTIGSATAQVNGSDKALDAPPAIRGSSTLVPLRFLGETLGATVRWVPHLAKVQITTPDQVTDASMESATGILQKAGPSIYMQGTHQLVDEQGQVKLRLSIKAQQPNLDSYLGKKVRVTGTIEPTVEAGGTIMIVESVELE